jgi:hypothetical protein
MRIQRDNLTETFSAFAEASSGVVVGAPGVGKTYLLSEFIKSRRLNAIFREHPSLCQYLQIDKLGVENESDLEGALGINGDFIQYLRQQTDDNAEIGMLVVDALDAARSENAQRFFLSLIRRALNDLSGRWNVIVSVRTYDAMKSQELQDLFPSKFDSSIPREYQMWEIRCRHFYVPPLSNLEREQAVSTIPHLPEVFARSSDGFRELLRIPFNLWLVEKLMLQNPDLPELSSVDSEIQILGLFWKYRVTDGRLGEERRIVLSRITREMINAHSMSVRVDEVYVIGGSETWNTLMRDEVLIYASESEQRIAFRHNILFDYAVSVLLIEDEPEKLISFLSEDPSRPFFLRPSLSYYFTRLWHSARHFFWQMFWKTLPNSDLHVRLFARLLPPTVVVKEARSADDLNPLVDGLMNGVDVANDAILRLLQAHRMIGSPRVDMWTLFLMKISSQLRKEFAWEVAFATNKILEQAKKYENELFENACGAIARNLFLFMWEKRKFDRDPWVENLGSVWAVPLVAKTFGTAPKESELLLSKIFELVKEPDYPIDYFYRVANEVDQIWTHRPEFVAKLYQIVFDHQEISEARTSMGGIILPLTSTRRQDFDMCRYALIHKYKNFLEADSMIAARTAVQCLNRFISDEHVKRYSETEIDPSTFVEEFRFRGGVARYLPDGSYAWDLSFTEEPVKMADSLFNFINRTAATEGNLEGLDSILDMFRDFVLVAFFWSRLLESGTRAPKVFAPRLFELCIARPVLLGNETLEEVGSFIEAAAPIFQQEQLIQIEETILGLVENSSDAERDYLEHRRNRLLARIPSELLQTVQAKRLRQEMEEAHKVPSNEPLFSISFGSSVYTEDMWLRDREVNPERPENQALLAVTVPLDTFASKWQNGVPSVSDVRDILRQAQEAYQAVCASSAADEIVVETAMSKIAACANAMSRGITDSRTAEFTFCRTVLLACSVHPSPQPDPEFDANYSHASWSPAPRTEAAQGLPWLAMRAPDVDLVTAIERLIKDPKPSVRFLATTGLFRLFEKSQDFFWRLAVHIADTEQNTVVLDALSRTLSYVALRDEQRTVEVLDRFFKRNMTAELDLKVLENAIPTVVGLALARRNEWARKTLDDFLGSPILWARPLGHCVFNALTFITPRRLDDPKNVPAIESAVTWLLRAIEAAARGIKELLEVVAKSGWDERSQQTLREVYGIIDEVVMRLYFNAKIKDDLDLHEAEEAITHNQRQNYYFTIKPLLEKVLVFALSKGNGVMFAPTAHYFMKLLNGVLRYDPPGVLHMAYGVAESSEPTGFNLDPMAVTEVVKLVEAVLADYRYKVREGDALQDLMSLLDIFAKTGSSEALLLVWRLDEIFR